MASEWIYCVAETEIKVVNTWNSCRMYLSGREVASANGLTLPSSDRPLLSSSFYDGYARAHVVDFFAKAGAFSIKGMIWLNGQHVAGDCWRVPFVRQPPNQPSPVQQIVYVQPQQAPAALHQHTVERQVLVARCKFCQGLTPVDLSACGNCGARGFA